MAEDAEWSACDAILRRTPKEFCGKLNISSIALNYGSETCGEKGQIGIGLTSSEAVVILLN